MLKVDIMKNKICLALFAGALLFTSCDRNNDNVEEQIIKPLNAKEVTIDAVSLKKWKYFSFTTGKEVEVKDPMASTDWDIAFKRYYVKTNSGTSGKGKGGAFVAKGDDFFAVGVAPKDGYLADDQSKVEKVGWPLQDMQMEFNSRVSGGMKGVNLTGYVTYDPGRRSQGKSPYEMTKRVYIIKTADGSKYVKIQFKDYLNEKNDGGYPKFIYQVAGSDDKF